MCGKVTDYGEEAANLPEDVTYVAESNLDQKLKKIKDSQKETHNDNHCPTNDATDASTAHFVLKDFNCKDKNKTPVPAKFRGNTQELMDELEQLQSELGGKTIKIQSGYRTPAYNQKGKGRAKKSRHMCGQAADITVENYTLQQVYDTIKKLTDEGKMKKGWFKLYPKYVHYDVRNQD